ncbi:MAG TPA: hypothetical protein VJP45_08675 [Candidatus Limnocylindria bacterium]|nr:hypothetical protein [Candidatus Limnocylindria bacterium]
MRTHVAQIVLILSLLTPAYAYARDPFEGDRSIAPPDGPPQDPLAFVVPPGLYYVTETYVGSVIETRGLTTTYSTSTVHESTGTYARVVDTVESGAASVFDGLAFNGRGALGDGRALAGTYYENFILTGSGYHPVSIVFFQDDSESRRLSGPSHSPAPTPATAPSSPTAAPTVGTGTSRPFVTAAPSPRPARTVVPSRPAYRAGVALAPDGPLLSTAEVLRGRAVEFWPRALANGRAVPLRSWRLLSAAPDASERTEGDGSFIGRWIRMPDANVPWILRFELFTATTPSERLETEIAITVRSPALVD